MRRSKILPNLVKLSLYNLFATRYIVQHIGKTLYVFSDEYNLGANKCEWFATFRKVSLIISEHH